MPPSACDGNGQGYQTELGDSDTRDGNEVNDAETWDMSLNPGAELVWNRDPGCLLSFPKALQPTKPAEACRRSVLEAGAKGAARQDVVQSRQSAEGMIGGQGEKANGQR